MSLEGKPRWEEMKNDLVIAATKAAQVEADAGRNPATGAIIYIRTATGWSLVKTWEFIKENVKLPEKKK